LRVGRKPALFDARPEGGIIATVAALPAGADGISGASGDTTSTASAIAPFEYFLGIVAAFAAALLPIAYSPLAASGTFVPKYAVLIVFTGIGIVPLCRLAMGSRYTWPARFGLAFVVVALISAGLSPSKLVGFFGLYLWGEGAIFLGSLVAAWAVGTCLGPLTRPWLFGGLLVGAAINAVVAIVQTTFNFSTQTAYLAGVGLYNSAQADGLMGNPIHLEAILLGALALVLGCTCRASRQHLLAWVALVALFSAALECSSERYALVMVVLLAAYAAVAYRWRSLAYIVAIGVGFGAASLAGAGASLGQRIATSTATTTFGQRIHGAVDGVLATLRHQPLLGFGPGEQRNALYLYQPVSLARATAGRYFTDVHDLPANIIVMTGIVGFLFFAAFALGGGRRARGAFAGYAAASFAVALIEPMNIAVTPLAFLALGAALAATCGTPWVDVSRAPRRRMAALAGALGVVALVPAVLMLSSDILEHSAQQHFSLSDGKTADALLPIWPQTAQELTTIYDFDSIVDPSQHQADTAEALQWASWAADRDPSDGEDWVVVGTEDIQLGDLAAAKTAADIALADYPLGTGPLELSGLVDANLGDWSGAIADFRTALSVDPVSQFRTSLRAAEAHDRSAFPLHAGS
jgi:hypothetical protein